jgi:hypothetical protein
MMTPEKPSTKPLFNTTAADRKDKIPAMSRSSAPSTLASVTAQLKSVAQPHPPTQQPAALQQKHAAQEPAIVQQQQPAAAQQSAALPQKSAPQEQPLLQMQQSATQQQQHDEVFEKLVRTLDHRISEALHAAVQTIKTEVLGEISAFIGKELKNFKEEILNNVRLQHAGAVQRLEEMECREEKQNKQLDRHESQIKSLQSTTAQFADLKKTTTEWSNTFRADMAARIKQQGETIAADSEKMCSLEAEMTAMKRQLQALTDSRSSPISSPPGPLPPPPPIPNLIPFHSTAKGKAMRTFKLVGLRDNTPQGPALDALVTRVIRCELGVALEGSVAEAYRIPSSRGGDGGRDGNGRGDGGRGRHIAGGGDERAPKITFRVNTWWEAAAIVAARGKLAMRHAGLRFEDVLTPDEQALYNRDIERFYTMRRAGKMVRMYRGLLEEKVGVAWGPVVP